MPALTGLRLIITYHPQVLVLRAERRRTRESLTRALERIAGRIAAAPTQPVEWDDRRTYTRESATITAKQLWVAGSYARGAVVCGDLDLIVELEIDGPHPPTRTIGNRLFGRAQDTSLYVGTPERNSANIAFPEARLVWSEASFDWKANIAAIEPDSDAGHFERAMDRLPLRPDQMSAEIGELEAVLEMIERRILGSEFVDAALITEDPGALKAVRFRPDRYGATTADALRLAVSYLAPRVRAERVHTEERGHLRFLLGGTLLLVGTPGLPLHRLETPFHDAVALVPRRSRRGPNGIWIIRRGPEHPVEKQFAGLRAFYVTCNGEPGLCWDVTLSENQPAVEIELFLSEEDALERAEEERDFYPDDDRLEVASASGAGLLQLIAGCDMVRVDGETFALSQVGQRALLAGGDADVTIADAAVLAAALGNAPET